MTLTLNTNLLSFTELVVYTYQFLGHWLQQFLKYPLLSPFPIEKPKLQNLILWHSLNLPYNYFSVKYVNVTPGSSFEQTMMDRNPRCYIPSFVEIGPPLLEKKMFEGYLPYMRMAAILVM